jgi:hypothetical protein
MAIQFSNAMSTLAAGVAATVYTVPASTTATVFGMTVANTSANPGLVTVRVGTSGSLKHIIKDAPLPVGGTMIPVGGSQKVVLTQNQLIEITVNNGSAGAVTADAIVSFMTQ